MKESFNFKEHDLALKIIGCNVLTYGHFDVYEIADTEGAPYTDGRAKGDIKHFLLEVEDFYKNKNRLNPSYGDDLKEQNAVKRFILSKMRKSEDACLKEGTHWVEEFTKE